MSDTGEPPPEPAESRAIELLGSQTPSASARFTADLVARARAQRAFAGPLRTLGELVAVLATAFAAAVRSSRRERDS
jgi:hypothetical protein